MGIPAGAKVSQAELPKSNKKKQGAWGIPGCPVVKTALPLQWAQVGSLVGEVP